MWITPVHLSQFSLICYFDIFYQLTTSALNLHFLEIENWGEMKHSKMQ